MPAESRFEHVDHSLDLDESLHVHAREKVARVATGLLILGTVALSATGLLGDGKLGMKKVMRDANLLEYPRILRVGNETPLEMKLASATEVVIPLEYFEALKLEKIVPEPAGVRVTDGAVTYLFDTTGPLTLRFYVKPEEAHLIDTSLRIDGQPFAIRQLILP